ncbi:hypothetical protein [Bacillus pseudomycoides]|nr:hypothetical protein [Bacillus pseudomycoides]
MDRCFVCGKWMSVMETNVGKHDEDLCNKCFEEQKEDGCLPE